MISFDDFQKVEMRVGKIIEVYDFPEARKPAYKLSIDFGADIGIKKSSAQVTAHYSKDELTNRLIIAVTNFPPKQIGPFMSEVLVLGVADLNSDIILLQPAAEAPLGSRVH